MKVLFVEDEKKVTDALQELCKIQNIECDIANDGQEGLIYAQSSIYDVIVLDIMLPFKSGIEILKEIRSEGNNTSVLLLTAKDSLDDIVKGLDAGADDYLVKPFASKELFARLRALGRRLEKEYVEGLITIGNVEFDLINYNIRIDGEPIKVTYKEALLLEMLIKRPEQVFTREQILDRVWGFDSEVNENNIEIYVHNLRKKLKNTNLRIDTVRSVGYTLRVS
ncbi:response regulator [Alkalibaculum sp. M08DMB]|uniref:Stage 0 sporulation protein A homolog n=1 Tax=Alkalibaculum sporogenes TaxID=2655001 RepID=A0A6A7K668_9FIRM|nr:response regulator transcription factor [Alkalibaculum sporogenes]MPW24882.1 response regulator [Alkalibaculum sporogenes]